MGWRPSPVDMSHLAGSDVSSLITGRTRVSSLGAPAAYAASYDLRTTGKLTPIRDQDPYGDCWAFATYASMESNLLPGETWDFSENNMAMNSGFDWTINDGGNTTLSSAYLARWGGPVSQADDPNDGVLRTGLTVRKHTQEMAWLPQPAVVNETAFKDNVKAAITTYGAVYTSIYSDVNAFKNNYTSYYNTHCTGPYGAGGTCTCTAASCGGHAIALVGWNDAYAASNFATIPPGPGAFIARNSWGTGVGEAGYFYISYWDTSLGGDNAVFYAPQAVSNYTDVYDYDKLGFTYDLGNSDAGGADSTTEWMSNIFTASGPGFIKAAGFYTTDINAGYTIYVYTGVTAGSPRTGTLAYTGSGTMAMSGYHTVTLGTPVAVSAGQRFSVVVRLTNPSYLFPVAVEKPIAGFSSLATASAGQSYFSSNGTVWSDMTSLWSNTNVCLKAYAYTDSTPPAAIAAVNDGSGADISKTGSASELSANWTASSDAESGIASYLYAIGTAVNDTSVTGGWLDNGLSLTVTKTGLSLTDGQTYYFGVQAKNGVGLTSAPKWSNGQVVDISFPTDIPYVLDGMGADTDYVSSLDSLSANWGASSFPAGTIDHYYYAIGTTPGGQQTLAWTDLGPAVYSVTKTGLPPLTPGQAYYFSVKAQNNMGNYSNTAVSDGQTVDISSPTASIAVNGPVPVPNGAFSVDLTVTEAGALASVPSLSFTAPDGSLVPLTVTGGGNDWVASGFIESYYSTGTATFHFSAQDGAGNTGSVINSGGTFLMDQSVSGITGGTVRNSDGDSVVIPAGASGSTLYVTISTLPVSREAAADASSYDSIKIRSVDLSREFKAHNAAGAPITDFSLHPVTITLAYPDANNDGRIDGDFIKEDLAWLYYMDEAAGKWTPLPGVVRHPAGNTLSAEVPHFSVYSVRVSAASDQGLAGLKAYPNPCDLRKVSAGLVIAGIPVDAVSPAVYIYNEAGELVRTLLPGDGIDGLNTAHWDGKTKGGAKAASGLYIYLVRTSNYGKGSGKFFIVW